jgi:hypothetical protein
MLLLDSSPILITGGARGLCASMALTCSAFSSHSFL